MTESKFGGVNKNKNNMSKLKTIELDGIKYVREDDVERPAAELDGLPYVIIRSRDSGVHAGYLEEREGSEVSLLNSRRLWYWDGAATLSQLATDGTSKSSDCKFACVLNHILVLGVCEVAQVTKKAQDSIQEVAVWKE